MQTVERKKNSLKAFKTVEPSLLTPTTEAKAPKEEKPSIERKVAARAGEKKQAPKVGRKPKQAGQKEIHQVGIRFNDEEYGALQKNAGLVPIATLIKDFLRKNSNLLK